MAIRLEQIVFEDVRGASVTVPGVGEASLLRSLFRILNRNVLCSIATVAEGRPHINTAYFCYSKDLALYFLSHPSAQHCRNVARSPSAGVTVYSSGQPWGSPSVGVQLFGLCRRASGVRQREAERLYGTRFRPFRRWRASLTMAQPGAEYRFFGLVVNKLKLLDEKVIGDGVVARAVVRRTARRSVGPRRRPTTRCS